MNRDGRWRLSPAFDVAYSYNPDGDWTATHQMSLQGRRDGFERNDLIAFAALAGVKKAKADDLIEQIGEVLHQWRDYAVRAKVFDEHITQVENTFRRDLLVQ